MNPSIREGGMVETTFIKSVTFSTIDLHSISFIESRLILVERRNFGENWFFSGLVFIWTLSKNKQIHYDLMYKALQCYVMLIINNISRINQQKFTNLWTSELRVVQ